MADEILRKKLPPNMRCDFWNEFIDAIEEESALVKAKIEDKKTYFDVQEMDTDRMLEIANIIGFPLDVSVDDSEDFMREEIGATPFKIKYKASTILYLSFFKALAKTGLIYEYYYNSTDLIRDTKGLLDYTNGIDVSEPYYQRSTMNFSTIISEDTYLDSGIYLDNSWGLDSQTSQINTKHLALEYYLNETTENDDGDTYLLTKRYFTFVYENADFFKKVTEVIHVGCQLGAITDSSGYYNSLGYEYTMPTLQLNCVTTSNISTISTVDDFSYICFGIGSLTTLPSLNGTGTVPTALASKVAKVSILTAEKYETDDYFGINAEYMGCMINDEVVGTGDGSTTTFSSTLSYTPVKPYNVVISFTSDNTEYTITDDGFGNLTGDNADGTIDYDTGAVTVNTTFDYQTTETLGTGDGSTLAFSYTTSQESAIASSIKITYIISGTTYIGTDDGSGNITGTSLTGTIVYTTGVISLTFTSAPASSTTISLVYSYEKSTTPDDDTNVLVEYYFLNGTVAITEAGAFNSDGNLVAYATFPPIEFTSYKYHLNMFFIIDKSEWAITNYDGGDSSTTTFANTIDGGDATTTSYSGTINGGDSDS